MRNHAIYVIQCRTWSPCLIRRWLWWLKIILILRIRCDILELHQISEGAETLLTVQWVLYWDIQWRIWSIKFAIDLLVYAGMLVNRNQCLKQHGVGWRHLRLHQIYPLLLYLWKKTVRVVRKNSWMLNIQIYGTDLTPNLRQLLWRLKQYNTWMVYAVNHTMRKSRTNHTWNHTTHWHSK